MSRAKPIGSKKWIHFTFCHLVISADSCPAAYNFCFMMWFPQKIYVAQIHHKCAHSWSRSCLEVKRHILAPLSFLDDLWKNVWYVFCTVRQFVMCKTYAAPWRSRSFLAVRGQILIGFQCITLSLFIWLSKYLAYVFTTDVLPRAMSCHVRIFKVKVENRWQRSNVRVLILHLLMTLI
jgi:hypothetical protein